MKNIVALILLLTIAFANETKAQEITMFNIWGTEYYEDNTRITLTEFKALMTKDPETSELMRKSRKNFGIGTGVYFVGILGGIALMASADNPNDPSDDTDPALFVPGATLFVGGAIAGIILYIKSAQQKRDAILLYNQKSSVGSLNLSPTRNGLSLAWNF